MPWYLKRFSMVTLPFESRRPRANLGVFAAFEWNSKFQLKSTSTEHTPSKMAINITGWWQLKYLLFSPLGKRSNLTSIFSRLVGSTTNQIMNSNLCPKKRQNSIQMGLSFFMVNIPASASAEKFCRSYTAYRFLGVGNLRAKENLMMKWMM